MAGRTVSCADTLAGRANAGACARGCAPCHRANGDAIPVAVGQSYRMDSVAKT